jgi:hypothetical protein
MRNRVVCSAALTSRTFFAGTEIHARFAGSLIRSETVPI